MEISIKARGKEGTEEYISLEENSLSASIYEIKNGDSSEKNNVLNNIGLKSYKVQITAEKDFSGVIRIELSRGNSDKHENAVREQNEELPEFFLPGFMYGTNRGEAPLVVDSKTPRLRMEDNFPASPWWMVRSDRLSHPCALMYGAGKVSGFAATPYFINSDGERKEWKPGNSGEFDQYTGFGCSIERGEVWYTFGYENAPWMFFDSHHIFDRKPLEENCFNIKAGETVNVTLYTFDYDAEDECGIHEALKWVYEKYHENPRKASTVKETVRDISTAIMEEAWTDEGHCYNCFVFDKWDHYEYRLLPSISWTNGLSAAVPMLISAHRQKKKKMRLQTIDCIDHIVDCSINERNDLPYLVEQDGKWSNHGWWYDKQNVPGHVAYLIGQSVYLILKAYEWEKNQGTIHDSWIQFAKRVISRTEQGRNQDGEYPYVFSEKTGSGLEYDSLSGAWCMAAAAYYCYMTGERNYIPDILKSEKWYYDTFVKRQQCYGGPLDTDKNMDSEGILSYIRAVRYLHEILVMDARKLKNGSEDELEGPKTNSEKNIINDLFQNGIDLNEESRTLLDHMRDALFYEYTYKFCYNSPVKVPPLSENGWSSCGGSITSVTNPHIHPMSSSIMNEMAYYLRFREDAYISSRLEDTRLWSCQCHNTYDKEFGYGKVGWMSERFCHCEGLLDEIYPDGTPASTWFALMPWACGSILEGLTGDMWIGNFVPE